MRGRFVRRMFALFAALFVLALAGIGLLAGLAVAAIHQGAGPLAAVGAWMLAPLVIVIALGAWTVGRALGRTAHPAADVVEAAAALAEGDYEVKVEERGPREMRRLVRINPFARGSMLLRRHGRTSWK